MGIAQMDTFGQLQKKIKQLVGLYEKQKEEAGQLRSRNGELEDQLRSAKAEMEELEEKHDKLKISKALIASSEDVHDAKLKVNRMVREIDKCIALLNR